MIVKISEYQVLSMHSEWVGKTQVRVKVRSIGNRDKIIAELFILRPENEEELQTSALVKIANKAVARQRVVNFDKLWLKDFSMDQKFENLEGRIVLTHVREIALAYQGY